MSHLIGCLLLVPLMADAEWPESARRGASQARGAAPTVFAPADARSPIRLVSAGDPAAPTGPPAVASGSALSVSERGGESEAARRALPPPRNAANSLESSRDKPGAGQALTTVVGSLAVVLAALFAFVWATRRMAPRGLNLLPREVVESLGRAPLCGRQQMQLVRIGNRLVLLSVTPTDARTLTEITDPSEVDRLAGLCEQTRPGSVTATFRNILAQCSGDSTLRDPQANGERRSADRPVRPASRLLGREPNHG